MHNIESRIEFPDPILITLDTSHGPITKNQRDISKNEVRSPLPTLCMEMWTFPFVFQDNFTECYSF